MPNDDKIEETSLENQGGNTTQYKNYHFSQGSNVLLHQSAHTVI